MNNQDKVNKDRQTKGVDVHFHKLKNPEVRKIRKAYARGNTSLSKIATAYDMAVATIHALVQGRTWKHLL